ncbi:helix-turn-helix domain-containing protein [Enterococcus songbeiensis]|uniref:helix-turn-helix domain-containing protein n=1 Tax=Enterococcus songbeiensis TaxID=2559927 RepID=UPI0010F6ADEA|nr:helix-turn-helix transcriptional regulator [Enterococcus songbeiensis]
MKTILNKMALKKMMKAKGYDERSLAKTMGVAPSTIYRILKDERGVGGELIPKLLVAFDLTEKDFDKLFIFNKVLPYVNDGEEAKKWPEKP